MSWEDAIFEYGLSRIERLALARAKKAPPRWKRAKPTKAQVARLVTKELKRLKAKPSRRPEPTLSQAFLASKAWKTLRYEVLVASDGRCACCGASSNTGAVLHVDHIKPRSKYPELSLERSNLQVLCADCNVGKWNTDETDWRQ